MMYQREQRRSARQLGSEIRQDAQRQAVDDNRLAGSYLQEPFTRAGAGFLTRPRESLAEIDQFNVPTQTFELGDNPSIICVAAGWGLQTPGHGESGTLHHKGASNCARATWDSDSVTRMAL